MSNPDAIFSMNRTKYKIIMFGNIYHIKKHIKYIKYIFLIHIKYIKPFLIPKTYKSSKTIVKTYKYSKIYS